MEKYPRLYKTFKYLALTRPGQYLGRKAFNTSKSIYAKRAASYGTPSQSLPTKRKEKIKVTLTELKEMAKKYKVPDKGTKRQVAARILAEKGHYKTVIKKKDREKLDTIFEA